MASRRVSPEDEVNHCIVLSVFLCKFY
jgi:hypothetical protein